MSEANDGQWRWDAEFWDEMYLAKDAVWSGRPNQTLVQEAAGLEPGRALDVGAGEGADAVWLARQGWKVTAADVSEVALERAAGHAAAAGAEVAEAIDWWRVDMLEAAPAPAGYDLVSAFFFHVEPGPRAKVLDRLAAAVAPGGTLLFVGHDPSHVELVGGDRPPLELFFTAEEIAAGLDPGEWEVVTAEKRTRPAAVGGEGHVHTTDVVLRARRR
ncbi:class I SAM-dependent methyltransferase [Nocardiopsis potens]|uniref:class I SAM-dependent methyltransferase n=1 Tax=Nocardiopsis potens TaxID=1246458 RepID=UPI0003470A14|nr:class I SAM-dependent methyltransferase [Nocardiopsis potens]